MPGGGGAGWKLQEGGAGGGMGWTFFLEFDIFFDIQFKNTYFQFNFPRFHLKDFFTRISKQVLFFDICGFKNFKIDSEVVNISMGHSVYIYISVSSVVET